MSAGVQASSEPVRSSIVSRCAGMARAAWTSAWTSARRGAVLRGLAFAAVPSAIGAGLLGAWMVYALPPVPVPPENPITEEKRLLGKILFWDEQLSTSNVVSCGTCHQPQRAGADRRLARNRGPDNTLNTPDDIFGSPGVIRSNANNDFVRDPVFALNPQITGRSANSMINAAYAPELFWDGRASGTFRDPLTNAVIIASGGALESQAVGPIVNSVEMAHDGINWSIVTTKLGRVNPLDLATNIPPDVQAFLADRPSYGELFERAFGDPEITPARIGLAIATYQRTLISDQTPFDRWLAGETTALTPAQVDGFNTFTGIGRCSTCHTVPLLTNNGFRNIGVRPPAEDSGRQAVTGLLADRGRFKVPGLRNVGLKRTFMHNGQIQTITDVVRFYARAPGAFPQFPENRDPLMDQVQVPPQAAPNLEDFLRNALTDPRVANEQFPFDRPLLVVDRPENQSTVIGGGVAGSGGIIARPVVQAPPMVGSQDYRVGLDLALGGAQATLVASLVAPVNGRIAPDIIVGNATTVGVGPGLGVATVKWPLNPRRYQGGQVLFAQWIITDPGAAGGQAFSSVARIPLFCGSYGCPPICLPDWNEDGELDPLDIRAFYDAYRNGEADFDGNGETEPVDLRDFLDAYRTGC